jgi:hypothetical protein
MPNVRHCPLLLAVVSAALVVGVAGQELPGQALPNLIRGNERLGRILLEGLHRTNPDRNVAVSPISVSVILAAIQSNADRSDIRKEIGKALGWGENPNLTVPSRMLLAAFEKPHSPPVQRRRAETSPFLVGLPEAAWISNRVLYRGRNTLSEGFVSSAGKYFGMTFASTAHRNQPWKTFAAQEDQTARFRAPPLGTTSWSIRALIFELLGRAIRFR